MLLPQEIIRRKRQGAILGDDEIAFFVHGITDGSIVDAQVGEGGQGAPQPGVGARWALPEHLGVGQEDESELAPGDIVRVRVTDATDYDLCAERV